MREREKQNQEALLNYNKNVTLNSHHTDSHFHQSGKLSSSMINDSTHKPPVKARKHQNAPHETDSDVTPNITGNSTKARNVRAYSFLPVCEKTVEMLSSPTSLLPKA